LLSGLLLILTLSIIPALAATDARMQVEVLASDKKGTHLNELHENIRHTVELALPTLWNRIIPQKARNSMSKKVNALQFMQRATPTMMGVSITFHDRRVFSYLKSNELPYIEQEPVWNLSIQLRNTYGDAMQQSASLLQAYAEKSAIDWGYKLDESGDSLILQWQWLDQQQVRLTARGTSRLGEFSETRWLAAGDPFPQLKTWLTEILLKARDAHAGRQQATAPAIIVEIPEQEAVPAEQPPPTVQDNYALLSIERQASLPEQVLFEDDLKREPRIISLLLRRVKSDVQQYRLHLKGSDNQWLVEWFSQRGLKLSPTVEGWVAR
jgi:hypothetical protein